MENIQTNPIDQEEFEKGKIEFIYYFRVSRDSAYPTSYSG